MNNNIENDQTRDFIKNREALLSHGQIKARKYCLDIMEHALSAVDPYHATHNAVTFLKEDNILTVNGVVYDLSCIKNIYIIGAGKATFRQAMAMDEILQDRITEGFVILKYGQAAPLKHIQTAESAHPVPDHNSFVNADEIIRIARKATVEDLVICLMSGGVSSNCCCPVDDILESDKITMNELLVKSGAQVTEIMTVRRHLSKIKGGRLGQIIEPATCITLTVSDAIGDPMEWNADWTHPDSSTFQDAVDILHKYDLWEKIPAGVRGYFSSFSPEKETPKSLETLRNQFCMTVKTSDLWKAAVEKSKQLGMNPYVLTTEIKGESREVGRVFASIVKDTARNESFFKPPCALIATGETGVRINGKSKGLGGANQELGCGACLDLTSEDSIAIGALDTDGTDGPTEYAGAITDGFSKAAAKEQGMDFYRELMEHNSTELLKQTGDIIYTGHTGSNVNDLIVGVAL